ncbi:FAD-dependent oxidoreductase [Betaproteobacteria bacterium PRO7]|jgi:NADPH-dependent glutamate synthase beta subunit-like oxidoreductase|nr:FAD-dependent oxidoreductase [Betaproteobacteria bacterium PRO7]
MNDPIPPIWTTGTTEVFKTGTWRAALPQHIRAPSPCHAACPVNGDIAEWIGRARARDFRGAWEILTRHNPFPAIAGRICHHPCEAACNRGGFDEPLAICKLERFVGDAAIEQGWAFEPPPVERAERVAVVGGGPSGLSAAFQIRRRGYRVTLFEAQPELGGLMRYGIPSYRLARSVLDAEIARIVALGVDVRCGEPLASHEDLERLRGEFDAVYLATGAQRTKRLPQLDYTQPWVIDGAEYLARSNAGAAPVLGKHVVVIGGGSAALDAARSARRAGHDVTILALESRAQMPAQREEVVEALEEGIALVDGAMLVDAAQAYENTISVDAAVSPPFEKGGPGGICPFGGAEEIPPAPLYERGVSAAPRYERGVKAHNADGAFPGARETCPESVQAGGGAGAIALRCIRVRFVPGVQRGQFTVEPTAGSEFTLAADAIVTSIGQDPELAALQPMLEIDGALLKVDALQATSAERVYAGGDLASVARFVTEAIGMGKRAAFEIDRVLRALPGKLQTAEPLVPLAAINTYYYPKQPRAAEARLDATRRLACATEVQLGLDIEQALAETERCFSCGTCIFCDNCVDYCPDLAVKRNGAGYTVLADYCKGCGLCVRECPTGSMKMVEEAR